MTSHSQLPFSPPRPSTPGRYSALLLMILCLVAWSMGAFFYIRGIHDNLDAVLTQIFDLAWTPAAVRMAASELGASAAMPAWTWLALETAMVITNGVTGLFLFWRKPDWFGAYLSLVFVVIGTLLTGRVIASLTSMLPFSSAPTRLLISLAFLFFTSLLYVFPTGHFTPAWTRWLMPLALGIDLYFWHISPGGNLGTTPRFLIFFLVFFMVGLGAQIYRYWFVSTLTERQQVKWPMLTMIFFLAMAFLPLFFVPNIYQFNRPPTGAELLAYLFTFAGMTVAHMLFVVALAIAILRYRLWEIDLIIRRTLVYTLLSLTLALLYFGSVVVLETLLRGLSGERQNQFVTVLSTLAIAGLFTPLRHRIQQGIDRRFYRRKYDAEQVLAAFGETVRNETDLNKLTEHLVGVIDETLQPTHIGLWLGKTERSR
ncbi:MAG: hypothetical protein U0350_06540 [Caldilineaceae bacterium]